MTDQPYAWDKDTLSKVPVFIVRIGESLAHVERTLIEETLRHVGGNKSRAAEVLGITLHTLYNRLRQYRKEDKDRAQEP